MWDTLVINPMINTLLFIYSLVGNFGLAIILFTILIRLLTHPLMVQQMKGTQVMTDMQSSKEWREISEKYKDDKQKLQQEQMRLYQEMGVNPLASCLPTVIQFPIIIGLYQAVIRVLSVSPVQLIDLSKHIYPFIDATRLIPVNNKFLWMDLSQPERLEILGFGIPILAIVVVITTYLQSKVMAPPPTPGQESAAQMTQAMNLYMPLLMGYFAYSFAAGLSVYFVASNIVSVAQYATLGRVNWRNLLPGNLFGGGQKAALQAGGKSTGSKSSGAGKSTGSKGSAGSGAKKKGSGK